MTAFAGIIRHDREDVPEEWLRALTARPDSRILSSSDKSVTFAVWPRGKQDAAADGVHSAPDGRTVLLDVRIDNRDDLEAELEGDWARLKEAPDAELARMACLQWGDAVASRLIGDFALCRWEPAGRRLVLARDRLGLRAIYFFSSPALFAFATEIHVLLALPFVARSLCDDSIARYLEGDGSGTPEATFYAAIRSLPSAHVLRLENEHLTLERYWSPVAGRAATSPVARDYPAELRERIVQAVACRLRDGKQVAVHLSGGLDSSTVACVAARHLKREGRRLLAICSLLPEDHHGPESDERPFIDAVLAQEDNIDPVWVRLPIGVDPFGALARWFDALAQPPFSNVTHIEEALAEAAKARGADVVLSGFGGDWFASNSGRLAVREMLHAGHYRQAFATLLALHREQGTSWPRLLRSELLHPLRRFRLLGDTRPVASPDLSNRFESQGRPIVRTQLGTNSLRETMRFVLAPGHVERVLAAETQFFAAQFGQELRFPLLDSRIIEWTLEVPAEQFQLGGWPRSLMRRAMAGILPECVRLRRDKGGAFDPAITSRFVAARAGLIRWAQETAERRCWHYVDRARFLEALQALEPASRDNWPPGLFRCVLAGGIIAHFIEWHDRMEALA